MNTNFASIIKRIVAEQGETVLADPVRLKPLIKDYAQNVPQDERRAFGRCIEAGFYRKIKAAKTAEERRRLKADLARQLQNTAGISAALCTGALDVLDAVVPPRGLSERAGALPGKITRKTLIFGAVGGAGALLGDLLADGFRTGVSFSHAFGTYVLEIAFWTGMISVGISTALLAAQHLIQHKRFNPVKTIPPALLGIAVCAASGGIAQMIFNVTQFISPLVRTASNALCWGLFGAGLGLGVSFFIPNYSQKRATLAGFLGGTLGGAIFVAMRASAETAGSVIGVIVLGCVVGLVISFIEEALREAWLTVIWGPKESATVSLGQKPVVFGAGPDADIYLAAGDRGPVRAIVQIENGRVVMYDNYTNQRLDLQNGSRVDLGKVSFIVNMK